jgi:ribosomal-protein-alanine N-acetyltransferase
MNDFLKKPIMLQTNRTLIRNLTTEDVHDVFEYSSFPEVSAYMPWETPQDISESMKLVNEAIKKHRNGEVTEWGIEYIDNHKLIGTCAFVWLQPENSKAEIGYALSPLYWNKGIMTEVIQEIVKYGFEKLNLNRIEAQCV